MARLLFSIGLFGAPTWIFSSLTSISSLINFQVSFSKDVSDIEETHIFEHPKILLLSFQATLHLRQFTFFSICNYYSYDVSCYELQFTNGKGWIFETSNCHTRVENIEKNPPKHNIISGISKLLLNYKQDMTFCTRYGVEDKEKHTSSRW